MARRRSSKTGLSRPLLWAVLLHAVLIMLLTVGIEWWNPEPARPAGQPIQAEVIDPAALDAARAQVEAAERASAKAERDRQAKAAAEERRIQELQRQREREQERAQAATEQRQAAEAAAQRAAREAAQQRAAAQKAEQAKKQADLAARAAADKAAQAKRRADTEAAAQAAERQREEAAKAAADKAAAAQAAAAKAAADKAAADRAAAKAAADKATAAQAAAAQAAAAGAERASQIDGFIAAIQRQVQARWRKPMNWPPGLQCDVRVKLLPSGEVVSVQVVSCDGDPGFIDSVQEAVTAASPLQVPKDVRLFNEHFRNFTFVFKAEMG